MLACFFCRAKYVPLSESHPAARMAYILQDSEAMGIVSLLKDDAIADVMKETHMILGAKLPPSVMLESLEGLVWSSGPKPTKQNVGNAVDISIPKGNDV